MYELEDISWEEFGRCDDHIVPRCGDEHAHKSIGHDDSHKKQQHEVGTTITRANDEPATFRMADKIFDDSSLADGRSPLVESSWSRACTDVFPLSSDPQRINVVSALASQGSRTSDSRFVDRKANTNGNVSCTNVSIGNVGVSNVGKVCQSSLADMSPEDKELQLPQSGKDRENDVFLDYEWDDIGNFENVDRMFRNCGTAFGQGSIGSADELSWFSSSSHTIDGCEDTFNFGIQSSYPEFSALTKSLKLSEADGSFFLENDSLTEAHDHSSGCCANTNWLDTDVEDSGQMKLPKGQYNTVERRKNGLSETKNGFYVHDSDIMQSFERKQDLSSASSLQTCPSPLICYQNPFPRADSFNHSHPHNYHMKMENGQVTRKISVKKSTSCVESEVRSNISPYSEVSVHTSNDGQQSMECSINGFSKPPTMVAEDTIDKICHRKHSHVPLDIVKAWENFMCQVSSSNHDILQNKSFTSQGEAEGDTELTETSIECPKFEIDYLTVQENSMITIFSDDVSLGSASFRRLQDMLDQLDIRTKLCIRDGLYRLARNAEMRLSIDSIKHKMTGSNNSRRIPRTEESKQSSEFIVETGTNLIDRSIAHLLFYRASDSSTSPINYATSHEAHITNHGSSTTPSNA